MGMSFSEKNRAYQQLVDQTFLFSRFTGGVTIVLGGIYNCSRVLRMKYLKVFAKIAGSKYLGLYSTRSDCARLGALTLPKTIISIFRLLNKDVVVSYFRLGRTYSNIVLEFSPTVRGSV